MKEPQPKLKLKYSKIIRPTTRKTFVSQIDKKTGKLKSEETGTEVREYRDYRETRSDVKGVITPRKIQMYRWWFRYLQLALELESLDFTFTEYRRIAAKGKKKGYDKPFHHKVVVNQDRYRDWDLDEVLTSNFDKWWKRHTELFVEMPTQIEEIHRPNDVVPNDYFRYFKVDTRMTTAGTIRSLREHLGKSRRSSKWTSQWTPVGEYRQEKLFNTYNGLLMWLQGKTTKDILSSGLFRKSRGKEIEYVEDVGSGGSSISFHRGSISIARGSKENLDKMRKEILAPGRRLVLIAADGYFAKHPRNKKYFGK